MLEFISFYLFAILVIASFSIAVLSANILYSMSALAAGMIFISGLFFTLGAEFLGVVQIAVYTGAVMALYAFGMMFFDSSKEVREYRKHTKTIAFLSVGSALLVAIIILMPRVLILQSTATAGNLGNVESLGQLLFTKYLLPFELAAIMLLIAMVAGIILVKKDLSDSGDIKDNL
ncbi:NADH-quinone oxidoreductase subunit J [Helicobacter sp. 23-1045]